VFNPHQDGTVYVLTAFHILRDESGPITVEANDGRWYPAKIIAQSPVWDIALLAIKDIGVAPCVISDHQPQIGEQLYVGGYGTGPMRWMQGPVVGFARPLEDNRKLWLTIKAQTVSGDSGGPVLDSAGKVCGIVWGGNNEGAHSTSTAIIMELFGRYLVKPTPLVVDPLPVPPDKPPFPFTPGPSPCVAVEKQVSDLVSRVDSLDKSIKDLGKNTAPDVTAIQQTIVAVQQQVQIINQKIETCGNTGERLGELEKKLEGLQQSINTLSMTVSYNSTRIEALEKQCTGTTPSTDTSGEITHLVLVRDTGAEYWPRLSSELKIARGHFSDIDESDPPSFSVALPQLVAYSNGVPVRVWKGVRQVGDALRAIIRDEFSAKSS
jgi:hypothetical protein